MYQKHSRRTPKRSMFRLKRTRTLSVLAATLLIGSMGTYMTVIAPRLRAQSEQDTQLVDQLVADSDPRLLVDGADVSGDANNNTEDSGDDQSDGEAQEGQADEFVRAGEEGDPAEAVPVSIPTPVVESSGYTPSWSTNVLAGKTFYLGSHNPAATTADEWRATRPVDAAYMDTVAAPAKGIWLVMGISNIGSYVSSNASAAAAQGKTPIFVLYGMPTAGCGGIGSAAADTYLSWVDQIDAALTNDAVVIIEPDELPLDQCGGSAETGREQVLKSAVAKLSGSGRYLYIDAGHGSWVGASTMAQRLERAGVEMTQGFSLNVSNYTTTAVNTSYGNSLSSLLGGAHFVIDTSRSGLGPDPTYEWCNAPGRALGELPVTYGSGSKLNALMWVKYPGESDGTCNGGPSEGQWWPEYALDLAKNAD